MNDAPPPHPSATPAALKSTLESKAKLLLLRERELYELRLQRRRAEEWLQALHGVWPERSDMALEPLARRAAELLVGALSFEQAATFEYLPQSAELVFACGDPVPVPDGTGIDHGAVDFLETHPVGRYDFDGPSALRMLAQRLGYAKFFWRCCSSYRGSRFLFLAGSSPRTAQFHTFADADREHFSMFTSHAAALLSNGLLVADVRRERAELELVNRGLDASVNELRETQAKLVASTQMVVMASRQAGMAEIATGILHNVGNALNSVNVCSEVALQHASELPVDGLHQVVALLKQQASLADFFATDPRSAHVLGYLGRLLERFETQQSQIVSELTQLGQHLGHVSAIVTRQQTYATTGSVERCALPQLMEDALLIARSSLQRGSVEVIKKFAAVPEVETDRHRVLQILVNLISNALRALDDGGGKSKRLVASICLSTDGTVRLAIEDNGAGISPADAPRLFQHGFTTRKGGHGFGLHTSALTAEELGGRLSFVSAGRGLGATFTLELPLVPPHRSIAPSTLDGRSSRTRVPIETQPEL